MADNTYILIDLGGSNTRVALSDDTALNPETGTISEGETEAEALANLTEATELYLEEFPLPDRQMPVITTIRIADVA